MDKLLEIFGVPAAIGTLVGIILIFWIDPTTPEGKVLLIVISILLIIIIRSISKHLSKPKTIKNNVEATESDVEKKIWLPGDDK